MKTMNKLVFSFQFSVFSWLLFCWLPLAAQELSGYVSGMPSLIVQQPESDTWGQMLLHNRLNFNWQMTEHLRVDAGMRNRFITGSKALLNPKSISHDPGWMQLSWNWVDAETRHATSILCNTSLDRLYATFEKDKWKLQAGRQRINWGQTFVWNPNDIFNTYSFFDFDYPERQGCDAFRGTFYHNETSSSELVVSYQNNKATAAFLHRWNRNSIDYQFIAGQQAETDIVIGGALTSDIKGLNFRSELSYFHPIKNITDTSGIIAVSVGADYIFSNSLTLQTEILYNNVNKVFSDGGLMSLYAAPLSAKYLSISNWNFFANASYPVTSRLDGSLSCMYFADIRSYYAGLSLDYSVIENLDFSFIAQYFSSIGNTSSGNMQILMTFARLKYSF